MNTIEHLLVCCNEEALEVTKASINLGKAIDKALRFGLNSVSPYNGKTNLQEIVDEFNDLVATIELLQRFGVLPTPIVDKDKVIAKQRKVLDMLEYARREGTVND